METVSPTVLRTHVRGSFERAFVPGFVLALEEWSSDRRGLRGFHDWQEMTTYDPSGRVELTRWTLHRRRQWTEIHFLLRSMMVSLGVQAANVALGGFMKTHKDRRSFEDAYSSAVASEAIASP